MEEFEEDYIFEKGDMVLLSLKNKEHLVGEFRCMDDLGVQMVLESRTAYRVEKERRVRGDDGQYLKRVEELLEGEFTVTDLREIAWLKKMILAEKFKKVEKLKHEKDLVTLDAEAEEEAKATIRGSKRSTGENGDRNRDEEELRGKTIIVDVTKPYLQMLKKPVRMLVKWENIDEMCSATDLAEDAEIKNFAESLENGDFNKLVDEMTRSNDD